MSDTAFPSADSIRVIAVLGAGTMGHGIAQVAAMAGYRVVLYDLDGQAARSAIERIDSNLQKGIARGKVSEDLREKTLSRIAATDSLAEAAREAELVIEAAPESLDIKTSLFTEAAAVSPAETIFATNTSSLSVAAIAEALPSPERVVGMHFFNPVHIMKLVEVVRHDRTDEAVVGTARALAERMGKTPIVVIDKPGFASSRLGLALGLEAMRMVEEGVASAEDIDTAMKLGYGHPMGPLELTDLVGLDVRLSIAEYLAEVISPSFAPPAILREKVASGELGKKSGRGFYTWKDGARAQGASAPQKKK